MNRYENGKIYQIVDAGFNKCYIGSTCEKLSKRMERHRKDYKEYCDGKTRTYPSSISIFSEFGIDNCKILLLELYPCLSKEELLKKEGEYIVKTDCVNKNIAGRTKAKYYEDKREHLLEKANKYYKANTKSCNERSKQHYENNKEAITEYKKEWYQNNKEHHKKKSKEYNENHKEELAQKNKERYEKNRDIYNQKRRERYEHNKQEILELQKVNVVCACGAVLRKQHLRRHEKSRNIKTG